MKFGVRRTLAILSVLFLLHAITPKSFFTLGFLDSDTQTNSQNLNTLAEEEEEHSEIEIKFVASALSALLPTRTVAILHFAEIPLAGIVPDIILPPPLLVVA